MRFLPFAAAIALAAAVCGLAAVTPIPPRSVRTNTSAVVAQSPTNSTPPKAPTSVPSTTATAPIQAAATAIPASTNTVTTTNSLAPVPITVMWDARPLNEAISNYNVFLSPTGALNWRLVAQPKTNGCTLTLTNSVQLGLQSVSALGEPSDMSVPSLIIILRR